MKRKGLLIVCIIAVILIGTCAILAPNFIRLYRVATLFEKDKITENFRNMSQIFHSRIVHKSDHPYTFQYNLQNLPEKFASGDKELSTADYIRDSWTTGLLVIKDNRIIYEGYYRGANENTRFISWSVAKSITSCLLGVVLDDRYIQSISNKADDYVPELKKSGYSNVMIKDILQMSSGIAFSEKYGDFNSDINKLGRAMAFDSPVLDVIASLKRESEPGKKFHYVSSDTQVLSLIIKNALKDQDYSKYFEEKIWKKIGAESDAYWLVDSTGVVFGFAGFNAVLRDYAKIGLLYLNNGEFNGSRIVSKDWVEASVTPDKDYLKPKNTALPKESDFGYGFQWWIPYNSNGDYSAIGVYLQNIYVNPKAHIVIAKTSAYPDYNKNGFEKECQTIDFFRAVVKTAR